MRESPLDVWPFSRQRGAIIRPLGDTVVLMPPLAIADDELRRLVAITAEAITEATGAASAGGEARQGVATA